MDGLLLFILIAGLVVMLGISIYLLIVFVHRTRFVTQPTTRDGELPGTARF